jgi:hypothetical protein
LDVFFEKLKEKGLFFGFYREGFFLNIVSNRRDKDKPSKGLICYMKV